MQTDSEPGRSSNVLISGSIGSVLGDVVGGNKGPDAKELLELLEARFNISGLQRQMIISIAQRIKPGELSLDHAIREIDNLVIVACDLIARRQFDAVEASTIDVVLSRVADLTLMGDFDEGRRAIDQGLHDLSLEHTHQKILLLEQGVKVDVLRRDASSAAYRLLSIASLTENAPRPAWSHSFHSKYYEALDAAGRGTPLFLSVAETMPKEGASIYLHIAVEMARLMLSSASGNFELGTAANAIGRAYNSLGELEARSSHLENALRFLNGAIAHFSAGNHRSDRAISQANMGITLANLGDREAGNERFEAALQFFSAALEHYQSGEVSYDFVMLVYNRSTTLLRLCRRGGGSERLAAAERGIEFVLRVLTLDKDPQVWAMAKVTQSAALALRGKWSLDKDCLQRSTDACHEALRIFTRTEAPFKWATIMNNIGHLLWQLSELEPLNSKERTIHLKQAVVTSHAALREALAYASLVCG